MFNLYDVESFYSQVPHNAKVCIWGAANAGISIKEELAKYRTDVKVVTYIDTRKNGELDGIKIYKPEDLN